MNLTQDWVGYLDRSYEQIKKSLLNKLTTNAPEITDLSESNPLIVLMSAFAGVGEMLNLYVDSNAKEAFLATCRRYASGVKLTKLIDYKVKARNPSSANILFSLVDADGKLATTNAPITIPQLSVITPENSTTEFLLLGDVTIPANVPTAYGVAQQYEEFLNVVIGVSDGSANQKFPLPDKYVDGSLKITIGADDWVYYSSFGLMGPTTKGFTVDIEEDGIAYVIFGDGTNGSIPGNGSTVYGDYRECEGASANYPPGSLVLLSNPPALPLGLSLVVSNPDYSSGGTNFETLADIKNHAPRSIRTLERAVTRQDYIDLAMLVLGVGAAEVDYSCGKYVDVYVAPTTRGIATPVLTQAVEDYLNPRKMVTTQVDVKPAGVTRTWIKAKVTGNPLYTQKQIQSDLLEALDQAFGTGNMKINKRVSITDVIVVAESLKSIDTFEVEQVKVEPYARPTGNTVTPLSITWGLPNTTQKFSYKLVYKSATNNFELYKAGIFMQTINIGAAFNDAGLINFTINAGAYSNNDSWEFTIFPTYPEIFPTTIISIDDFSAAIIDVSPFIDDNTPRTIFSQFTYVTQ
jgi:hypothetical protein